MVYCSALNCQNATSGVYKNSAVTFHGFPLQNKPLLRQWIHNMGRDMGTPSKHQRLCSKHFEDSSFEMDPLKIRKNRRLLKEAVPKKFILGEDGNWLVGTPRSFCGGMSNKTRKRIRNPEHSWVPGPLGNAAAREGKDLEDWQKELDEKVIKENYESLTTAGKGYPVPRSNTWPRELLLAKDQQDFEEREIPKSRSAGCGRSVVRCELRSEAKASEGTEPQGSFSGGPQGLACQIPDKGVTSEKRQNSGEGRAEPTGGRRGSSSLEEREADEFRERRCYQQTHPGGSLCLCAECQKTSTLKIGLLKHKQMHTRKNHVSSYICTDCGKSFGRHADLVRHQRTHTGERPYKCTECDKSFVEKPRLTNHLRTHNVYL